MNNLTNTSFLLSRPYWLGIYAEIIDLPAGLLVEIIDENQSCMSADWMQLEFTCQQGEQFAIAMGLEGVSMVEYFSASEVAVPNIKQKL